MPTAISSGAARRKGSHSDEVRGIRLRAIPPTRNTITTAAAEASHDASAFMDCPWRSENSAEVEYEQYSHAQTSPMPI